MISAEMYLFDKSTIGSRLNEWARWKLSSGVALGYPTRSAFTQTKVDNQNTKESYVGMDKECSAMNDAVDRLPHLHNIIIRVEYLSGYKDLAVKAYNVGVSKRAYYNYLDHAKQLIANSLNISLHNVHTSGINVLCGR